MPRHVHVFGHEREQSRQQRGGDGGQRRRHHYPSPVTQRKLLLVAYYRGGSTLTGQLINHYPSAFYWFEPLAAVSERWGWVTDVIPARNLYHFDNGTEKFRSREMETTLVEPLKAILSCNLTSLDTRVFRHRFMKEAFTWSFSFSLHAFKSCLKTSQATLHELDSIQQCLPALTEQCRKSSIVAAKVIRLHMIYVEQLLDADPDLVLVHLVRDPRGLVESWKQLGDVAKRTDEQAKLNADLFCRRMLADCRIRRQLERRFPGRVLLLRYEDLITDLDRVSGELYDRLLQLPVNGNVTRTLKRSMSATSSDGAYGTNRKNGTATAFGWQQSISYSLLRHVNNVCGELLTELKYTTFR